MPRRMPPLDSAFRVEILNAEDLVTRLEAARIALASQAMTRHTLHVKKLELLYELAYLRVFLAWENFLEQSFLRFLCGYRHSGGQESILSGNYCRTLSDASATLFGNRGFALWHTPSTVVTRAQSFFANGRHEIIVSSNQARLAHFAAIRHRIAHAQDHAKFQFDQTTMALCGKRYLGSRPGVFLRDWAPSSTPPRRWIDAIAGELFSLAKQINK